MRRQNGIGSFFLYFVLIILAVVFFYPLAFLLFNSLIGTYDLPVLLPTKFIIYNYYLVFTMIPFFMYLRNSLIMVCISVFTAVIFNLHYGYAFARLNAPLKNFWFGLVLSMMMIPWVATVIPTFIFFKSINLTDTYWIWVIFGICGSPLYTFLFRQYFLSLPKELEEAGKIDGCGTFGLIWRIFSPLAKPVVVVVAFTEFMNSWSNDYLTPYIYLSQPHYNLAITLFTTSFAVPNDPTMHVMEPVVLAAALLLLLPVLIFFFIAQRTLVEGIVTTGIKGYCGSSPK